MSRIHEALQKAELERKKAQGPASGRPAHEASTALALEKQGDSRATGMVELKAPVNPPRSPVRSVQATWKPDSSKLLFLGNSPTAPGAEAFRTLRTRLHLLRKHRSLQKIMVTSPFSQDGKTFVSANLAQALAQQGHHVLLIDADLRFSTMHLVFGAPSMPGLTEYLKGDCGIEAIVQKGPIENLFLVPGGKHVEQATELLANGRFEELLLRLSDDFDWLVFDSPPVVPVSDAKIIGEFCDGVIIVVKSDSTTLTSAQKACREVGNASLLGVVVNRVSPKSVRSSSYYYGKGKISKA